MRTIVHALLAVAAMSVLAPPASAASEPRAAKIMAEFLDAYEAVRTFDGRVRSETRKGGRSQSQVTHLRLQKPYATYMKILEAPDLRASEGTQLVWYGEPTVQVATRFFGFPVKLRPAYDDARLMGMRGWNMRQLSIASAVHLVRDPRTSFRLVGPDQHLGRPMQVVEARGPRLLPSVDRQLMWIDDQLKLPFVMEMYDGAERAFRIEILSFKFDASLPSDAFRLD